MKKGGDHAQLNKQPSKRTKIPTQLDPEVMDLAFDVEKVLYLLFQDMIEQLSPDSKELPEYDKFSNSKELRGYRETFRFFVHELFKVHYAPDIKSSLDLVSQWHTFGTGRDYGYGKPHSWQNPLRKPVLNDIKKLIKTYTPEQYGKMLKKAMKKADKELAKRK
jgi:hypothetical protein